MLPSSDPPTSRPLAAKDKVAKPASKHFPTASTQTRGSNDSNTAIDMLATESYTNPAARLLRKVNPQNMAPPESVLAMPEEYTRVVLAEQQTSPKTEPRLSLANQPKPLYSSSEAHGSHQTTPDSRSGYGSPEEYHGASDISVRKSISSATDTELFSDVEEEEEEGDDEPSGFEPTEVAELPLTAGGALVNGDEPHDFQNGGIGHDSSHITGYDSDSDDEQYQSLQANRLNRARTLSYECHLYNATSPTESQLRDEGFEFHNQLPEDRQMGQFNKEAFREALKEITPDLPRKQQWYAWRKVMEILERDEHNDEELSDDSELGNDYSRGSLAEHSFGGCQCDGEEAKWSCGPGRCSCRSCPRHTEEDGAEEGQDTVEDEEQDVPMNIGYTPVTPSFPPEIHHPRPSRFSDIQRASGGGMYLPGLEPFKEDEKLDPRDIPNELPHCGQEPSNNGCSCSCGTKCQCPAGASRCDKFSEASMNELFDDPLKRSAASYDPQQTWSDAATAGQSPPPNDPREPPAQRAAFPQIATALTYPMIFSLRDAPTPAPGFRTPVPSPQPYVATPSATPPRPDTPRPAVEGYEYGVRQSVEPEPLSSVAHRESTPAYEDRSLTPSPISRSILSDTVMCDATPVQTPQAFEREGSVLPDAPEVEAFSPPDSPRIDAPPAPALPGLHRTVTNSVPWIPAPPVPESSTLKMHKQRTTSTSTSANKRNTKSGVQGSKITKSVPKARNVTRKVTTKLGTGKREVTGARVRQAVDLIEDSVRRESEEHDRVVSDARTVLQKDGTPPRRSERVRARSGSPGA